MTDKEQSPRVTSIQAKISQEYMHPEENSRNTAVYIGDHTLDLATGCALIDDTNIAAQIRRAVHEYVSRRTQDPTLPDQIAGAEARRTNTVIAVEDAAQKNATEHLEVPEMETCALDSRIRHLAACALCQVQVTQYAERRDIIPFGSYPEDPVILHPRPD